jgi:hypothetical protein
VRVGQQQEDLRTALQVTTALSPPPCLFYAQWAHTVQLELPMSLLTALEDYLVQLVLQMSYNVQQIGLSDIIKIQNQESLSNVQLAHIVLREFGRHVLQEHTIERRGKVV